MEIRTDLLGGGFNFCFMRFSGSELHANLQPVDRSCAKIEIIGDCGGQKDFMFKNCDPRGWRDGLVV